MQGCLQSLGQFAFVSPPSHTPLLLHAGFGIIVAILVELLEIKI